MTEPAKKGESTETWEHGKLKLVLTRKSDGTSSVRVINMDATTQPRGLQSDGMMWCGSFDNFKAMYSSMYELMLAAMPSAKSDKGE